MDAAALTTLTGSLARTPCLTLEHVPDLTEREADTPIKVVETLGLLALWPRSQAAEAGFWATIDAALGDVPLAEVPRKLRDLRHSDNGRTEVHPARRHLTLFWDDPGRSAKRPEARRFFTGLS